ncbi:MAG: hypothetical protein IKU04_05695 [Bacteroidales bacterium]|nr:hypothetical protein [Bacteroidales bacterium]
MSNWRVWHSAKSFCEFIVDNTILSEYKDRIEFKPLAESDAAKGGSFHKVPDHIKKILYLDAADMIVEYNSEPIICIEETKEAGTGHNSLQRFARIAAAAENNVPAIYIMPEAAIISRIVNRSGNHTTDLRWDSLNPIVFQAFNSVMEIFRIPTLFFYFPSDYRNYFRNPGESPHLKAKGIIYDDDFINYPGCPNRKDSEMQSLFEVLNIIIKNAIEGNPISSLIEKRVIRNRQHWMQKEFYNKLGNRSIEALSPITATKTIATSKLLSYLSRFTPNSLNEISELLISRDRTIIYQCDSTFRGDPYAGTLAAIDYLLCRQGKTFEERESNLVLCFGRVKEEEDTISVTSSKCSVNNFIHTVHNSSTKNLLTIEHFEDLDSKDIGRYYMQVRYGSTYSKVKHIRVFSYFADAIIFTDGALWREA